MDLLSDLGGAVVRGEIVAFYQPQVDALSREIVAVEALARWQHPQLGLIPPTVFIPLAEENNLIAEIGDFMISEGCRCAAEWNTLGDRVEVSVNVSAAQLLTEDLLDHVADALASWQLAPDILMLEITESLPVITSVDVSIRLEEMRALGLGISVDDFGTGYSSLTQLMTLPASEVKIDRTRIQDAVAADPFLLHIVDLAHNRGLRVVAEGVENTDHLDVVRDLGIERAQGWLFGRPQPEDEMTRLLQARACA